MERFDEYRDLFYQMSGNIKLIAAAKQEAANQDLVIFVPNIKEYSEEVLDDTWQKYQEMTKPFRRRADWITMEYFGMDNQTLYDVMKSIKLSYNPKDDVVMNSNVGGSEDSLYWSEASYEKFVPESDKVNVADIIASITPQDMMLKCMQASNYTDETGFVMIHPGIGNACIDVNDLDKVWEAYNTMILKHRRESDWKMLELFGFSNMQYYLYKRELLQGQNNGESTDNDAIYEFSMIRKYFDKLLENKEVDRLDIAEGLANLAGLSGTYDSIIAGNIISDVIDKYDGLTNNSITIDRSSNDLPMYTPDELVDLGVYSMDDTSDRAIWFREYCNLFYHGYKTDEYDKLNKDRLHKLENWYITGNGDPSSIMELGWNPNIPFNERNRVLTDTRMNLIMSEFNSRYNFIDVRNLEGIDLVTEGKNDKDEIKKYPIYIALEAGKIPVFSDMVRAFTGGKYSHALLSFESSLTRMYSYGYSGNGTPTGGFTNENIQSKRGDLEYKVFVIFVGDKAYKNIKKNVNYFNQNKDKTKYSWAKLIKYIFHVESPSNNKNFICSEFVDKILKLANVDLTQKASSTLSPNDLDRSFGGKKNIYVVYDGTVDNYNGDKVRKQTDRLKKRAKIMAEASEFDSICALMMRTRNEAILEGFTIPISNSSIAKIYNRIIEPCLLENDMDDFSSGISTKQASIKATFSQIKTLYQ